MRVVLALSMSLVTGLTLLLSQPTTAHAGPDEICNKATGICRLVKKKPPTPVDTVVKSGDGSGSARDNAATKKARDDLADYQAAGDEYLRCIRAGGTSACSQPQSITLPGNPDPAGPPLITPGQAGAIAAVRLKIPTVAPGIGPSPDLNRWKMAAVGYPLWLWADGPTEVGPVSDSVAGLSVSLSAEVTSLTFRMGDGTTVNCAGVGNEWTKAVEPGTKAPGGGHTYTTPSLPKGNYEVTALTEWAVTWTANGQSGVINVPAVQSAELPVGELQVLVR